MRSKMQNQKGFTLVELMVVVVILGVLVAIAIPIYNSVTDNAKAKACASNIRIIEGAVEMAVAGGEDKAGIDAMTDLVPTFIKEDPVCPYGVEYTITDGAIVNKEDHFTAGSFPDTHVK